ncbi:TonB-dependent receptor [Paracidobacterium acidisoli]|uniref:TonB-dependent receptor n=1 Tax=Paracidobacterium acidisoli TaxID=2303751 RepID=A0A372IN98_9BACT|nr:TonB-dependent receptor [Paracidobacterium acidisoli]MBT9332030.1 TonB-dependent receptor [Paracidobacterium acidisoli]
MTMIRQLRALLVSLFALSLCSMGFAQSAQIRGQVSDSSGAVIPKAAVRVVDQRTGAERKVTTNGSGQYTVPGLDPSVYEVAVQVPGFSTAVSTPFTLNVAQNAVLDFKLQIGSSEQTVSVDGSGLQINTTDGSVSTVIRPEFVRNMPLNGRSFQDLISLTPGVVTGSPQSSPSLGQSGEFSVNGQRTESNFYSVDGLSQNTSPGTGAGGPALGQGGTLPSATALGTTQSILSIDSLQEFRVESSTYSAEYGHTPGGQFAFVSRSGTNKMHGSLFDYLRNNFFDARDWFTDHYGQPQTPLRQNAFGGTFGGPLSIPHVYLGRDRTFFFLSYEGLRLTQSIPSSLQYVPDTFMRQEAAPALQPILNAFPVQSTGGIDYGSAASPNLAQFFQSYSAPSSINSTTLRLDHQISPSFRLFGRAAYTPSSTRSRALSVVNNSSADQQTYALGADVQPRSNLNSQIRFGYGRSGAKIAKSLDDFGGAQPIDLRQAFGAIGPNPSAGMALIFPVAFTSVSASETANYANQYNVTDMTALSIARHLFKFGFDYRRNQSNFQYANPSVAANYFGVAPVLANSGPASIYRLFPATPVSNQFALFAQDEWRVVPRLSLSVGLRWEVNPAPHSSTQNPVYPLVGTLDNPSALTLGKAGGSLYNTTWGNFAPRLGGAWTARAAENNETVVRAGIGLFYDAAASTLGNVFATGPGTSALCSVSGGLPIPASAAQTCQPSLAPPYSNNYFVVPGFSQPFSIEWNAALQQALGSRQSVTISYVASNGRQLVKYAQLNAATVNKLFGTNYFITNGLTSSYNALQLQFQRQVSKGLQALASYTWSHSLDFGSTDGGLAYQRGNSDFDVRHNLQGGLSWELPNHGKSEFERAILSDWAVDGRVMTRTGFPVSLTGSSYLNPVNLQIVAPQLNLVPNVPIYLYSDSYPGGRAVNSAAFAQPTTGTSGNAPRNFVRGFGEKQVNLAVRRSFPLWDTATLQFRAEAFNVFNHPNFGYINPTLGNATFGQATSSLSSSLTTLSSLYQQGGARSMQFALKLQF